jgi:hypothetical protein
MKCVGDFSRFRINDLELVGLTGIEPVSITLERPPTEEEANWQIGRRKLCPRLCPNGYLPSTNTVSYGQTRSDKLPELSRLVGCGKGASVRLYIDPRLRFPSVLNRPL